MVKRDYNIVYSMTLKDGQDCYVKVKPVNDKERQDVDKLGKQEMKFVDFIAKNTGGLTSSFIQPGVVTSDLYSISIVTSNPGQMAQSLVGELWQKEDFLIKLGKQVRAFHEACKKFKKDEPKAFEEM